MKPLKTYYTDPFRLWTTNDKPDDEAAVYLADESDAVIRELEAERDAARADAERYRWLKQDRERAAEFLTRWMNVDARIDAARSKLCSD